MSLHLDRDLDALEQDLLAQSALVEEMIRLACQGLCERTLGLSEELHSREPRVNEREVLIEEECLKLLALHQPVAGDLRRVTTILKVNADLERIADLAVNLGERNEVLACFRELELPALLEEMSSIAVEMVRDALDALVGLDDEAARRVRRRDDEVDALNRRVINEVRETMKREPHLIDPALHLFSASRHIQRIADHATNIAEDVIYLVSGEIARHRRDPSPRRDLGDSRASDPSTTRPAD